MKFKDKEPLKPHVAFNKFKIDPNHISKRSKVYGLFQTTTSCQIIQTRKLGPRGEGMAFEIHFNINNDNKINKDLACKEYNYQNTTNESEENVSNFIN